MNTLKFKTNINCGSCVKSVSGFINEVEAIKNWGVNTENPDKVLTVEGENLKSEIVIAAVEEAGFDIEILN